MISSGSFALPATVETSVSDGRIVVFLVDDQAIIGEAVRRIGLKVAIPPWTVDHRCTEQNASGLLRHELRWARTLRAVNPVGYTGLMVTYPLPFALLMACWWVPESGASIKENIRCQRIFLARPRHL